jgi:glycosyltransferase involved in cell wall biosynthesis
MKILLLSSYEEGNSAWSRAAQNMCRALDLAGAEVVPRSYKLNTSKPNVHERVRELEEGTEVGCDVILHVGLPHHYSWDSRFFNIGYFFTESQNYSRSPWVSHCNLMDMVIVPNKYAANAAIDSGITVPIKVCPVPLDTDLYKTYEPLEQIRDATMGDYLFYFVGDFCLRKGLPDVLKAFYTEFSKNEPVNLVIKTSKYGLSESEMTKTTVDMVNGIKQGLRVSDSYSEPVIITESLSQEDLFRLHSTCHCLLSPSHGEAWGFNVLDAMGLQRGVITSDTGAFSDYSPTKIKSYPSQAFGIESFSGIMTGHETWESVDQKDLMQKMRLMSEWKDSFPTHKRIAMQYSLEKVGKRLLGVIEEAQ